MSDYQIVLKEAPATKVISLRRVLVKPPDQRLLWAELLEYCEKNNVQIAGTALAIYHTVGTPKGGWDIEVCIPVDVDHTPSGDVKLSILPAVEKMACTIHTGPFRTVQKAYIAINEWIETNGYHITGPTRELNVRLPNIPSNPEDSDAVNEIQFPIGK
ncbi:MAG: effector binding domain-containing protein [Anaerolineales bacterium]|nr:effector binding domain-containing protein [Anaerolineales bacterium]